MIVQVGNYDDIYMRNLEPLGFNRAGSPNDQWFTWWIRISRAPAR